MVNGGSNTQRFWGLVKICRDTIRVKGSLLQCVRLLNATISNFKYDNGFISFTNLLCHKAKKITATREWLVTPQNVFNLGVDAFMNMACNANVMFNHRDKTPIGFYTYNVLQQFSRLITPSLQPLTCWMQNWVSKEVSVNFLTWDVYAGGLNLTGEKYFWWCSPTSCRFIYTGAGIKRTSFRRCQLKYNFWSIT